MELPIEAIEEFKVIFKKNFGTTLKDIEAKEQAESFLEFMRIVMKPIDKRIIKSMKIKKSV